MTPTVSWVRQIIEEWNQLCFGGKLPSISIRLTRARTYGGQMACSRRRLWNGRIECYDFKLRLSTLFDHDEQTLIDTIIHELIHCEIFVSGKRDTGPHGNLFRSRMNEINRRFGRNIKVSEKLTSEQLDKDNRRLDHILCLVMFHDGSSGITRVARTRVFDIWDQIHLIPGVSKNVWLWSRDAFFNRFRRSQKTVSYRVEREIIYPHLKDAICLTREGDRIITDGKFDATGWFGFK